MTCLNGCHDVSKQGVMQKKLFGWQKYKEVWSQLWSPTHKKQLGVFIEYTHISELMHWIHQGKFVNIKWVRILFKLLSIWQKGSNVHEPLKNITYLAKILFFNCLSANFLLPKSSHWHKKTACIRVGKDNYFTIPNTQSI